MGRVVRRANRRRTEFADGPRAVGELPAPTRVAEAPAIQPLEDGTTRGVANEWIAVKLEEVAELLQAQQANPFRVRAYLNGADAVRRMPERVESILASKGTEGLRSFNGIGESLARSIEQLVHTGRLGILEQLRSGAGPEDVLCSVPGIGPELARRVHEQLGIDSLYGLEAAAWDGRLAKVPGVGKARVRAVRESLAGRFQRGGRSMPEHESQAEPAVGELLDVDREYREKAAAGSLPKIAPRRFNPGGEAWLPVLHTERGERHYTALFSNTARAHELATTRDWVVIYRDDDSGRGQWTVITAQRGKLAGQRIVRGREDECAAAATNPPAAESSPAPGL